MFFISCSEGFLMSTAVSLTQMGLYLLYIFLPIFVIYIIYTTITKAFEYLGFSSAEALIIVLVSSIFGFFEIHVFGFNLSNIYLFTYGRWVVSINTGGAVIPILLSTYLVFRKKLSMAKVFMGVAVVSMITFFVTSPDPARGIVSRFPFWLLPVVSASLISTILFWRDFQRAAPFAYVSGTLGVLIGADFLHLIELLNMDVIREVHAVIGGANVFDMVFLTGILAVILDGILMYSQRKKMERRRNLADK
ncbi:MAG: hypothetical protein DRN05_03535 [Thermoplasmata archaeon]|nr:MAG: hypothetical protein DRN05_03535 [Thermoplasmata archaeon]